VGLEQAKHLVAIHDSSSPADGDGLYASDQILAILLAMALSEQASLADVKNRLSEVVERIEREHGRVVITKHGRAAAVILSVEDLESLEETLAILSNPALMDEIREAERDVARGRTRRLGKTQVQGLIEPQ
jgi:prevent-host-death family protein